MKLSAKFITNILIILALAAAAMAVAWNHFNGIHNLNEEMVAETKRSQVIVDIRYHFTKQDGYLKEYIYNQNKVAINSYQSEGKSVEKLLNQLKGTIEDEFDQEQFENILELFNNYKYYTEQEVIPYIDNSNNLQKGLTSYQLNANPAKVDLIRQVEQFKDRKTANVNKLEENSINHIKKAKSILLILGGLALVLGLLVNHLIVRKVVLNISSLAKESENMAAGDLTAKVNISGKDELSVLAKSFNAMAESLRNMTNKVMDSSQTIASSSQQLSAASQQVSSAVDGISSTTSQVASMAQQGSANAEEAEELITSVKQVVEAGNKSVQETVEKVGVVHQVAGDAVARMEGLNEKSSQIGQITTLITEITEQTNMLALNAAIEAARAGEHGRGFAVVADEVRQLAERSAQAATQISQLVEDIQLETSNVAATVKSSADEVDEGMSTAQRAGNLLDDINDRIERVTEIITEVAAGSNQSSQGAQNLAATTEEVTASVQQIASSAQDMAQMADELQHHVEKFKV